MPTLRRHTIVALLVALAFTLAACGGQPPPEPEPATISGAVENPTEMPRPTTLTLLNVRASAFAMSGERSDAIVPLVADYGDVVDLGTTIVGQDGTFEVVLPDGDEIPAGLMDSAANAFRVPPYLPDVTCSFSASGSASLMRVWVAFELGIPFLVTGPVSHDLDYVTGFMIYSNQDLNETPSGVLYTRTWTHADSAVDITGTCVVDDGGTDVEVAALDVSLEEGWNDITFAFDIDEEYLEVTTDHFDGEWYWISLF
jgi:hypothetical protein